MDDIERTVREVISEIDWYATFGVPREPVVGGDLVATGICKMVARQLENLTENGPGQADDLDAFRARYP